MIRQFLLITGLIIAMASGAQKKEKIYKGPVLGVGISVSLPYNFTSKYNVGLAENLFIDIPVKGNTFLTLNTGLHTFYAKDSKNPGISTYDLQLFQFKAGFKHYLSSTFYSGVEAGASVVTNTKYALPDNKIVFAVSPQVGMLKVFNNKHAMDFSLRWESDAKIYRTQKHMNYFAFRTGYSLFTN